MVGFILNQGGGTPTLVKECTEGLQSVSTRVNLDKTKLKVLKGINKPTNLQNEVGLFFFGDAINQP